MDKADIEKTVKFKGFNGVTAGILKWPLSVIRLRSESKNDLVNLGNKILLAWR